MILCLPFKAIEILQFTTLILVYGKQLELVGNVKGAGWIISVVDKIDFGFLLLFKNKQSQTCNFH